MRFQCPYCLTQRDPSDAFRTIKHHGTYFRRSDGQTLSRFWCFHCEKTFSAASTSPLKGQKKRQINSQIADLLTGNMSQREVARTLSVNRKTVVRKFRYLASFARNELRKWNLTKEMATEVEFDDLETFEHTKCKPISITLMVEFKTRRILGYEVSQMPAKGHLAKISRKKYGPRLDHRPYARAKLFEEMQELVHPRGRIRSDSNPHYPKDVKQFFPNAFHETVISRRSAITAQGELKKQAWDPIFSLNHTCAMLRANISRLIRKTWCTTKKMDQLDAHIGLYALKHNRGLSTA